MISRAKTRSVEVRGTEYKFASEQALACEIPRSLTEGLSVILK